MSEKRPNVLWIMTDQLRADCLGFMGNPVVQTPNLDMLASQSVVFTNAFCQSPACTASRASLFTGRYPPTVRVRGMGILPPTETTITEVLRRHGYHTAASGKIHLTPEQYTKYQLKSDVPIIDWKKFAADALIDNIPQDSVKENYGFEHYVGCEDILLGNFYKWLDENYPELSGKKPVPLFEEGPRDLWVSPYPSEAHPTTFITNNAEAFIRLLKNKEPWFVFCSFIAPHHPFQAPSDQIARYDEKDIPLPEEKGGVDASFIPEPAKSAIGEMTRYNKDIQRRIILHYFASISLIDDCVGRLINLLKSIGQFDNTLIIFTADHGEFLGNHMLLRKPSLLYDETLRVPLLIKLPGNCKGKVIDGLIELVDVFPTILGFLQIPSSPGVQGIDWSTSILEGSFSGREDIYADMYHLRPLFGELVGPYTSVMTLRTSEWKLNIYPEAGIQYGQLFNLKEDPDESNNLYGNPLYRSIKEEMLWQLVRRRFLMADPLPLWLTQF